MISLIVRTLRLGFKSLLLQKLRSFLAMVGIWIGVMSVIWLVAFGEGVSHQAQLQIKQLGATNVIVKSVKPPMNSSRGGGGSFSIHYGLTRADFERIAAIPEILRAVPMREIKSEVRSGLRLTDANLLGCTPDYFEMNHLHMSRGRFLTARDAELTDNVCVIASETAKQLFPFEEPIGKRLQVIVNDNTDIYVIVGQTASRTPSAAIGGSLQGRDYNMDVYIPIETFRTRIGDEVTTARSGTRESESVELSQLTVTVNEMSQVEDAAAIIEVLLRKYHKDRDYSITIPKELLRQAENTRVMFNVLLALIAGISLVVGGIGIMNIMLATVTERTREIGVRRAMGAKQRDIVYHFLAETIVLCGFGGVLGVGCGFLCGYAVKFTRWLATEFFPFFDIQTFAKALAELPPAIQDLEPIIVPKSVVAAFSISVIVGIVFGLYPAIRAARMDPIEALRHE